MYTNVIPTTHYYYTEWSTTLRGGGEGGREGEREGGREGGREGREIHYMYVHVYDPSPP